MLNNTALSRRKDDQQFFNNQKLNVKEFDLAGFLAGVKTDKMLATSFDQKEFNDFLVPYLNALQDEGRITFQVFFPLQRWQIKAQLLAPLFADGYVIIPNQCHLDTIAVFRYPEKWEKEIINDAKKAIEAIYRSAIERNVAANAEAKLQEKIAQIQEEEATAARIKAAEEQARRADLLERAKAAQ